MPRFYPPEGQKLSPKLKSISKERVRGTPVFVPELRITVFTKRNETPEQTRERYLQNTLKKKLKNKL